MCARAFSDIVTWDMVQARARELRSRSAISGRLQYMRRVLLGQAEGPEEEPLDI